MSEVEIIKVIQSIKDKELQEDSIVLRYLGEK